MPLEQQLAHRVFRDPAYPYITNTSPLTTDSYFASGSSDILTSIAGYAQRRPGFSDNVETTPTAFNNLQRLFTWDRFDGTFIVIACDINASGAAVVYKLIVGTDASFSSIYTETNPTGVPFDFVTSNNTLYFSNGTYARKWDPINGQSLWGISQYAASASSAAYAGTGADIPLGGNQAWTNPGNVTGAPDGVYATNTLTIPGSHPSNYPSDTLGATNYGFAINAANQVSGIQLDLTGFLDASGNFNWGISCTAFLLLNGAAFSSGKSVPLTSASSTVTVGGPSDLWGLTSISPGSINNNTFGVGILINGFNRTGSPKTLTGHIDAAHLTVSSAGGPTVTLAGGAVTASTGFQYVICYGNSNTGHVGSPSVYSNLVKPTTQEMQIPVVASTDPQVNQIRVFRTTDSATGLGGQSYFEISGSPFSNTTTTVIDNNGDSSLNIYSIAPTPTFNDPPTPGRGLVYFAGRIWMFSGNKVYFTGLEEITIGVPEECMTSGVAGNFYSFDQPVQSSGVAGSGSSQALIIKCGGRLYGITGNTLDTFQRTRISARRGSRSIASDTMIGGMNAWLDSSNQIWATDGSSLEELSIPIRPDLTGITQSNCSMTFHTAGTSHWLVFSTGSKLYVYDIDTEQWMPPWNFAAQYVYSGEISPGNYVLMASTGTKAVQLNPSKFNDQAKTYAPQIVTNLMSVVPDFGKRFSYIGQGMYDEPSRTGVPYVIEVDTNNASALADLQVMQDDDPTVAAYSSIFANKQPADVAFNRSPNGTAIVQNIFPMNQPSCRWNGTKIVLQNADSLDKIYGFFLAYKNLGGR